MRAKIFIGLIALFGLSSNLLALQPRSLFTVFNSCNAIQTERGCRTVYYNSGANMCHFTQGACHPLVTNIPGQIANGTISTGNSGFPEHLMRSERDFLSAVARAVSSFIAMRPDLSREKIENLTRVLGWLPQ